MCYSETECHHNFKSGKHLSLYAVAGKHVNKEKKKNCQSSINS